MAHASTYEPQTGLTRWLDSRLPVVRFANDHLLAFPTPRNLTYMWTFGGILAFCLMTQIITGIVLAMHYAPNTALAFSSIEHIMRDVNYGWLLRYTHAVGASMFFFAVFMHIFRGMYYGSYKEPREVLWMLGVVILFLMILTAFMGYSLVWGQMSLWGVTVITNLVSALDEIVPGVGTTIVQWVWGGFSVDNATLNRLFSLHYLFPFIIAGVVFLHVWALHVPGNNNPTGVPVRDVSRESVPFHPYYTIKDGLAIAVFAVLFAYFVFYAPNYLGHADNYIQANPLQTPAHIVPEWYLLPFYAILRAIPSKLGGVIAMAGAIFILFLVPWLDTSRVRSTSYRPVYKWFFWLFVLTCIALGYLGAKPAEGGYLIAAQVFTFYYFAHFLLVMPLVGLIETPRPRPASVAESIFGRGGGARDGGGMMPGYAVPAAQETR